MADLPPSFSSDEDHDLRMDDSDDSVEEGLHVDFTFGGILGEAGPMSDGIVPSYGWSYQSAIDKLKDEESEAKRKNPRMDVASIIAAKRKSLKRARNDVQEEKEVSVDRIQTETSESTVPEGSESGSESKSGNESKSGSESESESESESDSESESESEGEDNVDDAGNEAMEADTLIVRAGLDVDEEDDEGKVTSSQQNDNAYEEKLKEEAFFESKHSSASQGEEIELFAQLNLSRQILRGVAAMGFVKPTKIQASVVPLALAGRDVCASSHTGSGKTASFLLPILERLGYRALGSTRALVLAPTRELAAQCYSMLTCFSQFTNIRSSLIVGGSKNLNSQGAELRSRPEIVVATPGRLLDHVANSSGITLDNVEFLVLDEADRLLDLGFQDEVHEIINYCPSARQTLLFSATMNTRVDDLVKLSLKRPVRVDISEKTEAKQAEVEVAPRLEQEFVRIRSGNEGLNREAMLLALLTRTFMTRTIVFFDTKATAHRLMIICGLCGIKCTELHGNLTQSQRLGALEQFRSGDVDILLATDLAARGLDIDRVETVINFEMPSNVDTYVHRIGRTARAGRGGRSCTLIGEGRRHLMKEVIRDAAEKSQENSRKEKGSFKSGVIRSRTISQAIIRHFVAKIESLESHVIEVLQAEAVARLDRLAEMEACKAENIIAHSDEIMARPKREWFASDKQKKLTRSAAAEKQKMIEEKKGTGTHRMTRKKRRAREAREQLTVEDDDVEGGADVPVVKEASIRAGARAWKREQEISERKKSLVSINDMYEKTLRKPRRATHALGDSSMFNDERVAFSKKKSVNAESERKSSYKFRGYDPDKDMGKKTKKRAVNKFKSKSKYKRR